MTAVNISKNARAAIEVAQWVRNGKPVVADLQNRIAETVGHWVYVRTRCVFRSLGGIVTTGGASPIPNSLATRNRWPFAWHSGPYTSFIYVRFEIAPENGGSPTDPYCQLDVNPAGGAIVGSAYMHWGSSNGSYADVPINFGGGQTGLVDPANPFAAIFVTPDTDYEGMFRDIGKGRLHSAAVWEVALEPSTENGYPSTTGSGAPIFDADRHDPLVMARSTWARGAAQLWNWHADQASAAPSQVGSAPTVGIASLALGSFTVSAAGTSTSSATFDATVSSPGAGKGPFDPGGQLTSDPMLVTITATAGGIAQTNGSIYVTVYDNYGFNVISSIATTIFAGWSETGWSLASGIWTNRYTRSSVALGTTQPVFQVTLGLNSGHVFIQTTPGPAAPQTSEATGTGNAIDVHVFSH